MTGGRGDFPSSKQDQFALRLPDGLRDRIKSHAKANSRSMNTEVILALEAAFPAPAVPESVNEAMFAAASAVLDDWGQMLAAIGQDPATNPKIEALANALKAAETLERNAA